MTKASSASIQQLEEWKTGPRPKQDDTGILIAHLGNLRGANPAQENTLAYLNAALRHGYHVCCVIEYRYDGFLLPTARGYERAPSNLLSNQRVWCCAQDPETLDALCSIGAHSFAAATPFSLTTAGFIWAQPGTSLVGRSIAVCPENAAAGWYVRGAVAGVCSDEIARYA